MQGFANRVILITGAGSGIGRQLAITLAGEGAVIAAMDLQAEALAGLAAALPGRTVAWAVADVTDRPTLHQEVNRLAQVLGPIDCLIASAGIGYETSALSFRAADFEAHLRVNLVGVANSIEAVLPSMLERHQGHLVAISSLASYRGMPGMAGYCASKSGLNAMMESLRVELKPAGIDVTTICPGWVRTPLTANVDNPMPHLLEVEDAVQRMVQAMRQRKVFVAFPAAAVRKVRLLRWLPDRASDWLLYRVLRSLGNKQRR